jgi:RNA polymerase sigma factor (sigma-70 family)
VIDGLFRRESAHLVAAIVRLLGPGRVALAEDVVQDALVSAMQAWRFGAPDDPKAWLLRVAKNRAIDVLRRERKQIDRELTGEVELAFSPEADAENQLAMMFAVCDDELSSETHVTLILRYLCGFSGAEIARAFLADAPTIDRRLSRGRTRLRELPVLARGDAARRQPSVERALYLLFSEGYHGSDTDRAMLPAMCADAIRLVELLPESPRVHALAALFCLDAARMPARLDDEGVFVPLADQDRSRWDTPLVERGIAHLGASAGGDAFTRWHIEAGIAFEHTNAASFADTRWDRILDLYDALAAIAPGPIVTLNRALALAEVRGLEAGRRALAALADEPKLAHYSFYWAARADVERRAGRDPRAFYARAIALAKSRAERVSYERRLD